ncbi:MAG: TenA family transcriptional regulator, partial [Acidobacteria bacterium]|nr:TenA family transcriptional regulator [Acidobacteriota bacterium]
AYTEPFGVLAAILFGVEASYLEAWSALEPKGPYTEFIERWSNLKFREYVGALAELAGGTPTEAGRKAFTDVLVHERDFWTMAYGG